jgi:hypothetical protein
LVLFSFPKEFLMMMRTLGVLAVSSACMAVALAEELVSGLPVGKSPSAFHPLNITGESAGTKNCLI